ncbi:MAG: AAA family ATPase [bacterium]|nr:AAA family ATPase [bacterium]
MHLKRLELIGFKSFASKTVLDFPAGITGVVGPNGSGKTNVVDAIRWLLGEREAKNIRGAKVEDLIFAGTQQRPRSGMAQATIVFDNSSRFFPVDYAEVAISRRVTRDGTSEYSLNESPVRLKDVVDFFAKSRLGSRGLSIIGQGNSDIFVRATPKERRAMLEEILGLRQFQLKKHEAERKLQNTKINLDKVEAMVEEIAPHLRLLKRQTAKWEKQEELQNALRERENKYFGYKLYNIQGGLTGFEPQLKELDLKINTKFGELKLLQAELKKIEESQPKDNDGGGSQQRQNDILSRRSDLQRELGRLEAEADFLLANAKTDAKEGELLILVADVKKIIAAAIGENDISNLKDILQQLVGKIDEVLGAGNKDAHSRKQTLEQSRDKVAAELSSLDQELSELRLKEESRSSKLGEFNQIFKKAFGLIEAKKTEIAELSNQKNKLLFDKERVNIKLQDLENQIAQTGRRLEEFGASIAAEPSIGESDLSDMERRIFKLRAELAGIGDIDESLIKEAQETENRFNFLKSQSEDLGKASKDLHQLIKDLDKKIHTQFTGSLKAINDEFNKYFRLMFGGGKARLHLQKLEIKIPSLEDGEEVKVGESDVDEDVEHEVDHGGIDIELDIPQKRLSGLDMLSGGEKSLVSIAALFALISVSPPPFLVLDEVDAALDESNTRRFANLIKDFSKKTQFLLVTHNRATMEAANILYGVTMNDDGTSRVLSVKFEDAVIVE